jgi:hypothetical protein
MIIEYAKKPKIYDFENKLFTYGKQYEVLVDYRNRTSMQKFNDSGLVIKDDTNQVQMVFLDSFKIVDKSRNQTYVFNYNGSR